MTRNSRYGLFEFDGDTNWVQGLKGYYYLRYNHTENWRIDGILYSEKEWEEEDNEIRLSPLELVDWNDD